MEALCKKVLHFSTSVGATVAILSQVNPSPLYPSLHLQWNERFDGKLVHCALSSHVVLTEQ